MKFPTTVRYGARALVELAAAYPDRAVSVREVGQQQNLSAKYLERILQALKAVGLVQVVRGSRGGYVLARPSPEHCTQGRLRAPRRFVGARRLCGLSRFVSDAGHVSDLGYVGRGERGGGDGAGADHDPGSLGTEGAQGQFVLPPKTESRLCETSDGMTLPFRTVGPRAVVTTSCQPRKSFE